MARHPQPLEAAKLKGADVVHPERFRDRKRAAKAAAGLGSVPERLSGDAAVVWLELEPTMPTGVLTIADRVAWESLCELVAEMREKPRDFSGSKWAQLVSLLARFGMTPADRAKVSVTDDDDKPANAFAEFAA